MGIHGIYKEIGPGERIALSKLAVDKFEETGRPFRIAIDVSIWLFQIQASKGGTNPALRTFYYRLLRLIALCIHPIFVFDGPNKPPFKRNKRTGPNVASIPEFLAKQLLKQFGFPIHLAPGEAEAECALLQREGIVDAVLSEDVDTLMFGSGLTIRNWSPELKTSKTPTHVNIYDAVKIKHGPSGLDREGMILVALMSGGDYVPEGIPGCGPKTACEAARAGFGRDLCKIAKGDTRAMRAWRERLQHELKTNESKLFTRKRPSLKIPEDFPRTDILGYYTHPAISSKAGLDKLRRSMNWDQDLDLQGLRDFTLDAFDWVKMEGAKHFIRSLAPALLVRQLRTRGEQNERSSTNNIQAIEEDEALLVKGIHGKRNHVITDNTPELRVSFVPIELVKIDLGKEEPDEEQEPSGTVLQTSLDEDLPLEIEDDLEAGPKRRGPTKFDPNKVLRVWTLETYVKVGVPLKVQDWEASRQQPLKVTTKGARRERGKVDAPQASIARFAKITKPGVKLSQALAKARGGPLETSTPQPKANHKAPIVDLLSSSPVRPTSAVWISRQSQDKSLSPVREESLVPQPTRRRAPMQRSRTLPSDLSAAEDPFQQGVEIIDLTNSLASPSGTLPAKKEVPRVAKQSMGTRTACSPAITSPEKNHQTTLNDWRSGRATTPTKPRQTAALARTPSMSNPCHAKTSRDEVDTLDLTLSSPVSPPARHVSRVEHPRRTAAPASAARSPLISISPNASQVSASSSASQPSRISKSKAQPFESNTCCTSPRLHKTKPTSPVIDTLDLTLLSPGTGSTVPPPRLVNREPSPPAAWKTQAKKKREIVLRKSLAGAWDFVDVESPGKLTKENGSNDVLKGKEKRRWRESQVEVLDLC